jgi:hypothetical protein
MRPGINYRPRRIHYQASPKIPEVTVAQSMSYIDRFRAASRFPGRPSTQPPGDPIAEWDVHRCG